VFIQMHIKLLQILISPMVITNVHLVHFQVLTMP